MLPDDELVRQFDAALLPKEAFRHREHVRAAFLYLSRYPDLAEAALHFRRALKRFAAAHGVPGLFHETLTWAWLVLINQRMQAKPCAGSLEFLRLNPDLCSHLGGPLARHYDIAEITASPLARQVFVLPAGKD